MQTKDSTNHPTTKSESDGHWNQLDKTGALFFQSPKTNTNINLRPKESWFEVVVIVVKVGGFILYDLLLLPRPCDLLFLLRLCGLL